jgi:hypothetical protein
VPPDAEEPRIPLPHDEERGRIRRDRNAPTGKAPGIGIGGAHRRCQALSRHSSAVPGIVSPLGFIWCQVYLVPGIGLSGASHCLACQVWGLSGARFIWCQASVCLVPVCLVPVIASLARSGAGERLAQGNGGGAKAIPCPEPCPVEAPACPALVVAAPGWALRIRIGGRSSAAEAKLRLRSGSLGPARGRTPAPASVRSFAPR